MYIQLKSHLHLILFNVAHPCKPLAIPENGAKVCNGWKKDFGEFCLAFCGPTYSLDIRYSHQQWYVCGTSGQWIPNTLPYCTGYTILILFIIKIDIIIKIQNIFRGYTFFSGTFLTAKTDDDRFRYNNCSTSNQIQKMQETYLAMFQTSAYNDFCTRFHDQCRRDNVDIVC